jgi:hypothetical protein
MKKKPLTAKSDLRSRTPLKRLTAIKQNAKPKKQPKPAVSKLKKEADKWHSLATRYRFATFTNGEWGARCVTCNQTKPLKSLQCGHFMSRMHNSTRYSEENTAPQCYGCNVMHQGRQYQFGIFIDQMYGSGTAQRLYEQSRIPHQFTVEELMTIIEDSRKQVEFYESQV